MPQFCHKADKKLLTVDMLLDSAFIFHIMVSKRETRLHHDISREGKLTVSCLSKMPPTINNKGPEGYMHITQYGSETRTLTFMGQNKVSARLQETVFRGADTVATLLEWIMARMTMHPDIQSKAQEELDLHVGPNTLVQDSDLQNLPYLQAIVKEVLRLHPPGPLLSWSRLAIHDVYIDKMMIPAGTTAMVNMWAITHDPTIWKDPWAFNPTRFIDEDVMIMGSDLRLAPFGSGRRVCPGRALGLATVHMWLARMLHEFKWLPAQPVDLSERLRLSLEMKKPLSCYTVPRCSGKNTDIN